jgi:hypothetical protein
MIEDLLTPNERPPSMAFKMLGIVANSLMMAQHHKQMTANVPFILKALSFIVVVPR